jgi:hypothetical protein
MKLAMSLAGCLLLLGGCAKAPTVGPLDVDPNVPFLTAAPASAAPTTSSDPSPTSEPSASATPTSSASPSASATATSSTDECTKTDAGECIKDGETCPDDQVGKTGTGADDKKFKCKAAGDENRWKAA